RNEATVEGSQFVCGSTQKVFDCRLASVFGMELTCRRHDIYCPL
uniref:Uncharacterized protein n=1 Tax=Parascaris univalens TaxID=6257 RepID=A0A915C999_PARUN